LTLIESGIRSDNLPQIAIAFAASAISLGVFVVVERRTVAPLLDLRLLKDKILLPSYIIVMASGVTMYLAYPSIVQLVRSPIPLGFGGDAVAAANVQMPFVITFLIFASLTPFIINRIGNVKPIIIGTIISAIGAFGLLLLHSTEFMVSANLAVMAAGLSMIMTASMNVIVSSSPIEFTGISVGVGALLIFVGMSIGPALTGAYMEDKKTIEGVQGSYASPTSYNLVFFTSGLLAVFCLGFASILQRRIARNKIGA
jgi:MFS family permease